MEEIKKFIITERELQFIGQIIAKAPTEIGHPILRMFEGGQPGLGLIPYEEGKQINNDKEL